MTRKVTAQIEDFALAAVADTDYDKPTTIWCGTAGNITVTPWGNSAATFTFAMAANQKVPVRVKRYASAGLTAGSLVAIQ